MPTSAECNQLAALFNAGHFGAAEVLAQTLIHRCPDFGFAWKVLGASLQVQGKDALTVMQNATSLMPNDAGAHSNLGNTFSKRGRHHDAMQCYRRALAVQPDLAEAHFNLGLVQKALGFLDKAALCYRRALAIKSDYVEAHNNLGNVLRESALLDDAVASYRIALSIKSDYIEAHNNLIYCLRDLERHDEAAIACRVALTIQPNHAETHNNLGCVLCDQGELDQASTSYHRVLTIDPEELGSGAASWLAVLYYLKGDMGHCRNMLDASKEVRAINTAEYRHARNYRNYVALLLAQLVRQSMALPQTGGLEALYVIGESHSLSAHGVVVDYRQRKMRAKAEWILGCKQWHLGGDKANRFKRRFEIIASALPRRSTLLLTIGEIDCRPDEGIIKVCQKDSSKSLENVALATVSSYIAYISKIVSRHGHHGIICGVPATNAQLESLSLETAKQLVELIRLFNAYLREKALAAGMDFLDVYAMTDRGDGISTRVWHIDSYHLQPSAIPVAFDRHCIRCN